MLQRLHDFLEQAWDMGILRIKGFAWLATRPDWMMHLSLASSSCSLRPSGRWLAGLSREDWDLTADELAAIESDWDESYGDRRQELVVIGTDLDRALVETRLADCQLMEAELAGGQDPWTGFADPFPLFEPRAQDL